MRAESLYGAWQEQAVYSGGAVLGLSPMDAWLWGLLVLSAAVFAATAILPVSFIRHRAVVAGSIGLSAGFVILALASGLAVVR